MKSSVVVIVASLAVSSGLVAAPAAVAGEIRPDVPITKALGQRYLKLVCPTNHNLAASEKVWDKAFGEFEQKRPPIGTPVPMYFRAQAGKLSVVARRDARKMRAISWPRVIQDDIDRVIENQFLIGDLGEARDTPVVEKGWFGLNKGYHPWAGARIRKALGLPKSPGGC